jgi:hypothetical protein
MESNPVQIANQPFPTKEEEKKPEIPQIEPVEKDN